MLTNAIMFLYCNTLVWPSIFFIIKKKIKLYFFNNAVKFSAFIFSKQTTASAIFIALF